MNTDNNNPQNSAISTLNPYFIGTNENTSTSLVTPLLTGPNFHSWRRAMEISIGAKSKLGFVNGSLPCPLENDPWYGAWMQCNLIVMSWIINSVSIDIGQSILYVDTATKMWRELTERFSQGNEARIYELHQDIHATVQGELSVSAYFTKLETHWNSLNVLSPLPRCSCGVTSTCSCNFMSAIVARENRMFKMIFLMGLNERFSLVRSQILLIKPLPTLNDMYAMVTQDEKQKSVHDATGLHSMALVAQTQQVSASSNASYRPNSGKGNMKCSHCGSNRHVKDKCYRLHGYPPGWRPRPRNFGFQNQQRGYNNQPQAHQVTTIPQNPQVMQFGTQQYGAYQPPCHSPYPIPTQVQNSNVTLSGFQHETKVDNSHQASTPFSNLSYTGMTGERAAYDIDVRMEGEVQPQLEASPITKYISDTGLILGRRIAVNKTYICYALKMGAIRVLNINTALRSLLRGLAQKVTDMAFFAEDVHLLASASIDGRIYVWKLTEGLDEKNMPVIIEKIIIAIQIVGEGESVHPRVCWHCHKQEVLVIGIGRSVLRIDTTKVGKAKVNSTDEPLRFAIDNLIDGVQLVGKHEGEVTDLSMCQWLTTRLVSASADGTIKIWDDLKAQPLLLLRPHDGQPVNSVTFLTAPRSPDHIILITGGPHNREVKIWVSGSEEGWLLPSGAESLHCTQTLDFKSSASRLEESFFNQVVALPGAELLLLANAKKNAIYAVHLDYGVNPTATRMDYVTEFTVTMPILSFTGTSDLSPHGEHLVQVYCVQTQAIQQYDLKEITPTFY